jgi:hypothetical protein
LKFKTVQQNSEFSKLAKLRVETANLTNERTFVFDQFQQKIKISGLIQAQTYL